MKNFYKKKFALTDQGAEALTKASISSFFVYCINMVPAFIIMMLIDELVLENAKPRWLYFAVSFVTLLFMYWLLDREYENLYNSTYKESAHLRGKLQTICQIYHYPIFQNIIYQIYLKLSCLTLKVLSMR